MQFLFIMNMLIQHRSKHAFKMEPTWIPKPQKSVQTLHLIKCLEEAPKFMKKAYQNGAQMEPKCSPERPTIY